MGLRSWLEEKYETVDTALGGYLPLGAAPSDVQYRDTIFAVGTGTVSAVTLGTAGALGSLFRGRADLIDDVYRGAYSLGSTGQTLTPNYTFLDAGRSTLDTFTPDFLYSFDDRAAKNTPGSQRGGFFPEGWIPDAWEKPFKDLGKAGLAVAALIGVVLLGRN